MSVTIRKGRDPVSTGRIFGASLRGWISGPHFWRKPPGVDKRFQDMYIRNWPRIMSKHGRMRLLDPRSARREMSDKDRALFQHVHKYVCENITMQPNAKLLQRDITQDFAQKMGYVLSARKTHMLTLLLEKQGASKYNGRDGSLRTAHGTAKSCKGTVFKHITFKDTAKAPWNQPVSTRRPDIMSIDNILC